MHSSAESTGRFIITEPSSRFVCSNELCITLVEHHFDSVQGVGHPSVIHIHRLIQIQIPVYLLKPIPRHYFPEEWSVRYWFRTTPVRRDISFLYASHCNKQGEYSFDILNVARFPITKT